MPTAPQGPPPLLPLVGSIVYGPVTSRRLGSSLGLNILPRAVKACSFNCVYCQYGWTSPTPAPDGAWPSGEAVYRAIEERAADPGLALRVARLTLAGHGEPTLHPDFPAIVEAVRLARDRYFPHATLALLSNGTRLHVPSVRVAMRRIDEPYVKLDAGDQDTLRRVNASAFPIETLVESIRSLPGVVLQSLFVHDPQGRCGNDFDPAVSTWMARVVAIRPRAVHLYTLARSPALTRLAPVSREWLSAVARRVQSEGIQAEVF